MDVGENLFVKISNIPPTSPKNITHVYSMVFYGQYLRTEKVTTVVGENKLNNLSKIHLAYEL